MGEKQWMKQVFRFVMVVESLEKTIANWKEMVEFDESSIEINKDDPALSYADFDMGGVSMRLVEPVDKNADNTYAKMLREKGPNIHHIDFMTDDVEGLKKKYEERGYTPVFNGLGESVYDFSAKTGLMAAFSDKMEGPCAR